MSGCQRIYRGTRIGSGLWVAVTRLTTVFMVSCSRGRQALQELIGESFQGILHSDRWGAYNILDPLQRQLCWAHLKRDFQALSERKTRSGPLGEWGLRRSNGSLPPGTGTRPARYPAWAEMQWQLVPVRPPLGRLLRLGAACGDPKAEALCRNLLKLCPALLTSRRVGVHLASGYPYRDLLALVLRNLRASPG
jgi:transposase